MPKLRLPIRVPKPEAFIAPWPVELIATIPALNYNFSTGHYRAFRRLAHVLVPDCQPGDLLDCSATLQVSNNLGELVEFSAALVLTPDSTGVAGIADPFSLSSTAEPPGGQFITRFPGFNVTSNPGGMHHAPFTRAGRYIVPDGISGDQYVAYIAYAGGQTYDPTRTLTVDQWCGDLSVIRHR